MLLWCSKLGCLKATNMRLPHIPPVFQSKNLLSHNSSEYSIHGAPKLITAHGSNSAPLSCNDTLLIPSMVVAEACPNFFEEKVHIGM